MSKKKRDRSSKPDRLSKGEAALMVLGLVGVAGIVIVGAIAPGLLALVPKPDRRRYSGPTLRVVLYRLGKKGWLAIRQDAQGLKVVMIKEGREAFQAYALGQKCLERPKEWDGKWRLLAFDVREERRFIRDQIRTFLKQVGFHRLQDSLWAYPFECKEVVELLQLRFGSQREALYMRVEYLDNDRWLRKHFELEK